MRTIKLTFLLLLAALIAPLLGHAAQPHGNREGGGGGGGAAAVSVRAILFIASKQPGPTDREIAPYVENIRANFRFESFRFAGDGSAAVAPGEKKTISLPKGNSVEVSNNGGRIVAGPGYSTPAVIMGGSAGGKGEIFGIIVVTK